MVTPYLARTSAAGKLSKVQSPSSARAEIAAARTEAACAVAEAAARTLSATQQLQVERTGYESEIASLRREHQAILDSTIWRASAPLRMVASWLPSTLKRAARGSLKAISSVLAP